MEKEFNLITEPWIRVITPEGRVDERNLADTLVYSHEYLRLAGETPAQDVAVLRLLLAVMQTVVYRYDEDGEDSLLEEPREALERWKRIWESGRLPEKEIGNYLEIWKERFWLFHPEFPFYQVPEAKIGTECKASKLNGEISESSNKVRLFSNRSGVKKETLSFAEAARWLIYVNGFDDTSAKPKEKGRPSVGAGWLGKLGLIYVNGENLFETLMLNLVLLSGADRECWAEPKPVWELEHPRVKERVEILIPDNQAELLTLQSRRLLLKKSNDRVTGYTVLGGDFFQKENARPEQMTVWRYREEKGKAPYYQPRRHTPDRQMWRGFANIITFDKKEWNPGIVDWIMLLKSKNYLDKKRTIQFRIASVCYGDKDFFVSDISGDYIDLCPGILIDSGKKYVDMIQREVKRCEDAAMCLYGFVADLAKASGNTGENSGQYEKEEMYSYIDIPFRNWLSSIDPEKNADMEELRQRWIKEAYDIVLNYARRLLDQSGNQAYIGRMVKDSKGNEHYYSSTQAFNTFCYRVGKCFDMKAVKEETENE